MISRKERIERIESGGYPRPPKPFAIFAHFAAKKTKGWKWTLSTSM